ncbi:MAG: DUF4294 domain-containing protein [Saprospiraceae bacterium]|jgi:hypothetical protein|nr:DUF4294 domain-containing protein [Saprospiraceae bacterium]
MKKQILLMLTFSVLSMSVLMAQEGTTGRTLINGQVMPFMIDECGDTLILANLDNISISTPRQFDNKDDYRRYRRYRRYAVKVYPYAVEAIKIFREVEYVTENMKKRERKKYIKKLNKRLKKEFKDPLKKLTKTQGKILIKMIERELDTPMYDLIKDLRGGFTATYYSTMGSLYGHKLKDGYTEGEDLILDAVLTDMDISHELDFEKVRGPIAPSELEEEVEKE